MASKSDRTELLKRIRENFTYYARAWREVREEAAKDMKYISGDPWEPEDRSFREKNDRPCMTWDELSPYINKLINDPKQNKRSIQVSPRGAGANDQTAEGRENLIREICYDSKAQAAFTTAFQGGAERSYGWAKVSKRYITSSGGTASTDAFNQELHIGRIPNPDAVLPDPDFKEIDASDMMGCFVIDKVRIEDFKRDYPSAEKVSFTADDCISFPEWVFDGGKNLQIAEWWEVTLEKRDLLMFKTGQEGPVAFYEDELPAGFDKDGADSRRTINKRVVTQYMTNGVEILDEVEIEIPYIPYVPVFGKEIWVDDGSGAKRQLISLTRMARDPFMFYCFARSQEAEEAGLTPKTPFITYKGQINPADREIWETINKIPRAYVEVTPVVGENGQLLPLPQRQPFVPNFQAYEVVCEAARRAIQTAMSGSALPTAAQRRNEKSGVALKEIDAQEDQGTFHFIDNYNHFLQQVGRVLDAWIPFVYDTKREVGVRKADETHQTVRINDPENIGPDGKPLFFDMKTGEHSVTISVGQDFDSQRAEASEFVDTLLQNLKNLPIAPPQMAKILSLAIKLKQIGPLGKEMADIISPPDDQAAVQGQLQQSQQQLLQQKDVIVQMQQELEKLRLEKAGKVIDNEYALKLQDKEDNVKVLIAEINTKMQDQQQRLETFMQFWKDTHQAAHEAALQADQQQHEKDQATQAQAATAQQQQQQQQADAAQPAESTSGQ